MKFLYSIHLVFSVTMLLPGSLLSASAESELQDVVKQPLLEAAAQKTNTLMNSLRRVFSCFCIGKYAESALEDAYRIYTFGEDQTIVQQDIDDLVSIFNKDDERLCSKADFDLLFPDNNFNITRDYIEEASRTKRILADYSFICECDQNCPPVNETDDFYTQADLFIIRDAANNFVGLGIIGSAPKSFLDGSEEERELITDYVVFVASKFRGKGYAKILLQRIKNHLLSRGITEISFHAMKNNPACAWYDRFGFTKKEDVFEDGQPTGLYEYSGTIPV